MAELFDDIARILASPVSRRRAFRLIGGAVAGAVVASFGVAPLQAVSCSESEVAQGKKTCGNGRNAICCPAGHCCAGNGGACCTPNQCACRNGTCAASTNGACPGGCELCQNP